MATTTTTSMLDAALAYAGRGWAVVPCHAPLPEGGCTCDDADCGSIGKHPRTFHGLKDASANADQIRQWWTRWPNANIGIVTGAQSGIVVLDIDPRHGGNESLAGMMDEHGELPESVESRTGGGGAHIVFTRPGSKVPNSTAKLGAGLDVEAMADTSSPRLHSTGAVRFTSGRMDAHPTR